MFDIATITVQVGRKYKNRGGDIILIKTMLNKQHPDFKSGFRFVDEKGRTYTIKGRWSVDPRPTTMDLISELG